MNRAGAAASPAVTLHRTAPHAECRPPAMMAVRALRLTEFRNYRTLRHEFTRDPVVLCGPNGAGKTNLLEAISLLSPGRGLRGAKLAEMRCRSAAADAPWAVAAHVDTAQGAAHIGTGNDPGSPVQRRAVRIDGRSTRGHAPLAAYLAIVWLTPAMDRLFTDSPGRRRDFLDRLVGGLEPNHAHEVAAYEKSMRARMRLLENDADPAWIDAGEETMAAHGVAVAAARGAVVRQLSAALRVGEGPFPRASVALNGVVEAWLETAPAIDVEQRFAAALRDSRARDRESGVTAVGVHRSDIVVSDIDRGVMAAQCSTGEQKALLIAIVLASARLHAARRGSPPLLLLDEVAAHLDSARRSALLDAALTLGGQTWFTGADAAQFDTLAGRAQFLTVSDGRLRPGGAVGRG